MKRKIISGIKIYCFCIIYILIVGLIYSFYLMKTNNNSNQIMELVMGITNYLLLGLLYANMIHKRGLIVGLLAGVFHLFLFQVIFYLIGNSFNLQLLPSIIYIISSCCGGLLGITFKKII